ncbi:Glycosyl hydrolases family 28 [Mariniphaga anaerophila]|uniref:Glycosyl hydrolases family 28 n=1 Tax=Mariniphaga anaerophila TaxID=1484053 RepID=A0A1M5APH1_9BACT|nr:glycoside hydrolase family 28 protein [Mariniphaga anaerophila]SHF32139.1 Glycosyl hydrolases family 28 [Mariniphaga anaerophila]
MKSLLPVSLFLLFCLSGFSQTPGNTDFYEGVTRILENISEPVFEERIFEVKEADLNEGNWNDFINKKIKTCSEKGGGKVVLNSGIYFCEGPVVLLSNVNLHLKDGARLLFSQNSKDYLPVVLVRWEGTEAWNYSPFIYAKDAKNIAITGNGVIDGNGLAENSFRSWRSRQKPAQNKLREMGRNGAPVNERIFGAGSFLRPQLIHFINCKNILLEGVTVTNGSFWLIQPTYCSNVTIRGVRVESKFINNDGVDIDSSTDVLIEDCHFNTGDDFVAVKSGRDQDGWRVNSPSKNIVVRNSSSDGCLHGISFGSEISGGIENVYASNLSFKKVRKYALQFKSNKDRGGYIKSVFVNGIQIDSTQTGISFTNQYHSYSGGNYPSSFENIRIENLICNVAAEKAVSLVGLPEKPIRKVVFENIKIKTAGEKSLVTNVVDLEWNNIEIGGDNSSEKTN